MANSRLRANRSTCPAQRGSDRPADRRQERRLVTGFAERACADARSEKSVGNVCAGRVAIWISAPLFHRPRKSSAISSFPLRQKKPPSSPAFSNIAYRRALRRPLSKGAARHRRHLRPPWEYDVSHAGRKARLGRPQGRRRLLRPNPILKVGDLYADADLVRHSRNRSVPPLRQRSFATALKSRGPNWRSGRNPRSPAVIRKSTDTDGWLEDVTVIAGVPIEDINGRVTAAAYLMAARSATLPATSCCVCAVMGKQHFHDIPPVSR